MSSRAGAREWLSFLAGRLRTGIVGRTGGAPKVPFVPEALLADPGLTWIGHAAFLVRMDGATFLTDPIFSRRASPLSFAGPARLVEPGVPLDALPPVDFVVLSHDHYDHTDVPSIRALAARGARFFVPLGLGPLVRAAGGTVSELDWWESAEAGPVRVHCVPARHFSGRGLTDRGRTLWAGWVVQGPSRRFYHAGDTGYFDAFAEIGRRLGPIDLAALPIGAYLPSSIMRPVHMDPEEAVQAALDVASRTTVGMHWGTFDLTEEPLDEPPRRFRAEAARRGLAEDHVWVLAVGESRRW